MTSRGSGHSALAYAYAHAKGVENRCVSQLQVVVGEAAGCGTGGPNRDGAGVGRAASGWWVGPNGKNSRSNLGGVCVWEGGVSVRAPDVDELVRTAGCREARERRRGRERGFPEKGWASDAPPPSCPIGEICLGVWSWHRLCALVHIGSYVLRPIAPHRRQRRRTKEKLTGHQTKWRLKCCPQRRRRW